MEEEVKRWKLKAKGGRSKAEEDGDELGLKGKSPSRRKKKLSEVVRIGRGGDERRPKPVEKPSCVKKTKTSRRRLQGKDPSRRR